MLSMRIIIIIITTRTTTSTTISTTIITTHPPSGQLAAPYSILGTFLDVLLFKLSLTWRHDRDLAGNDVM
jgi:hypothetical protein